MLSGNSVGDRMRKTVKDSGHDLASLCVWSN